MLEVVIKENAVETKIGGTVTEICNDLLNAYSAVIYMIFENWNLSDKRKVALLSDVMDSVQNIHFDLLGQEKGEMGCMNE